MYLNENLITWFLTFGLKVTRNLFKYKAGKNFNHRQTYKSTSENQ